MDKDTISALTERAELAERVAELRAEAIRDMNGRLARLAERAERAEARVSDLKRDFAGAKERGDLATLRAERAETQLAKLDQAWIDLQADIIEAAAIPFGHGTVAYVRGLRERAERAERLAEARRHDDEQFTAAVHRADAAEEAREKAERERDDLSAQLDAMTNQAVMLSGRRATIVDVSAQSEVETLRARLAEVERERDAAYVAENVACKDAGTFAIENDKLRTRLAALEAAMPTDEERRSMQSCVDVTATCQEAIRVHADRCRPWLARLDAARNGGG